MKIYDAHPAAKAFPPLKGEEMEALKRSMLEHGQLFPAVLLDDKLLDGRNRQEALRQLVAEKKLRSDTQLKVVPFNGGSVAGFADAANDKRRHLTESQRAMTATKLLPLFRKEAKDRQAAAAKSTNRAKTKAQKALTLTAPGRTAKTAAKEAAKAAGGKVSARSIERAEFVRRTDPELAKKVFEGELTVKQAEKKIRKRELVAKAAAYVPPTGTYSVIVSDPPWQYDDTLGGINRDLPYPTMSLEEIAALAPPAAEDCVLWLWVTNAHMPHAFDLLKRWGFDFKTILTWAKDSFGIGRWLRGQTEHVLLAAKGTPTITLTSQSTLLRAPVREHSEKPAEFFALVESLCPSTSRLEMYARKPRTGWVTSGSELAPLPASGESAPAQSAPAAQTDVAPAAAAAPSFSSGVGLGVPDSERSESGAPTPPDRPKALSLEQLRDAVAKTRKPVDDDHANAKALAAAINAPLTDEMQRRAEALRSSLVYECANCHLEFMSLERLKEHQQLPCEPWEYPRAEGLAEKKAAGPVTLEPPPAGVQTAGYVPPVVPGSTSAVEDEDLGF